MRGKRFGMIVLALLGLACPVQASVSYSYSTDTTNTASGGAVTINLYLNETLTGGSGSLINPPPPANQGMFSASVALNVLSGPGLISSVAGNTNPIASGGFSTGYAGDLNSVNGAGTQGAIIIGVAFGNTSGPLATQVSSSGGTTINQILIGTATFTGVTANTIIAVTSFNNAPSGSVANNLGNGNTVTFGNNGYDLDSTNNAADGGGAVYTGADVTSAQTNTYTLTAGAATPEPSSIALCGLALGGMGFGAWRRRMKAQVAATAAATVA